MTSVYLARAGPGMPGPYGFSNSGAVINRRSTCDSICSTRKRRRSAAVAWFQAGPESWVTGVRSICGAIAPAPDPDQPALYVRFNLPRQEAAQIRRGALVPSRSGKLRHWRAQHFRGDGSRSRAQLPVAAAKRLPAMAANQARPVAAEKRALGSVRLGIVEQAAAAQTHVQFRQPSGKTNRPQ